MRTLRFNFLRLVRRERWFLRISSKFKGSTSKNAALHSVVVPFFFFFFFFWFFCFFLVLLELRLMLARISLNTRWYTASRALSWPLTRFHDFFVTFVIRGRTANFLINEHCGPQGQGWTMQRLRAQARRTNRIYRFRDRATRTLGWWFTKSVCLSNSNERTAGESQTIRLYGYVSLLSSFFEVLFLVAGLWAYKLTLTYIYFEYKDPLLHYYWYSD